MDIHILIQQQVGPDGGLSVVNVLRTYADKAMAGAAYNRLARKLPDERALPSVTTADASTSVFCGPHGLRQVSLVKTRAIE